MEQLVESKRREIEEYKAQPAHKHKPAVPIYPLFRHKRSFHLLLRQFQSAQENPKIEAEVYIEARARSNVEIEPNIYEEREQAQKYYISNLQQLLALAEEEAVLCNWKEERKESLKLKNKFLESDSSDIEGNDIEKLTGDEALSNFGWVMGLLRWLQ